MAVPAAGATRTAVPGQVIAVTGKGPVKIGGKRARVVGRSGKRRLVMVPVVKAGLRTVTVGGRRVRTLRIKRRFSGVVKPHADRAHAASGDVGPRGGTVSATAADGTRFELTVPAGALPGPTAITLTPVTRIGGFPLSGKPVAVQMEPSGLDFFVPATLRITSARRLGKRIAGFSYGRHGLQLQKADGLTLEIHHFSGAGAAGTSGTDFTTVLATLAANAADGTLTFDEIQAFVGALLYAPLQFDCSSDFTCKLILDVVIDGLEDEAAKYRCSTTGTASDAIEDLRHMLEIAGDVQRLGVANDAWARKLETARRCITEDLVNDAALPAALDPFAQTRETLTLADLGRADLDGSLVVNTCEWAVYVAHVAAAQGYSDLQGKADNACEGGLRKVLSEGTKQCDAKQFKDGQATLKKGANLAGAIGILTVDFSAALDKCQPKITIAPALPTVEISKTLDFTATSEDPDDTSFSWSVDKGQIDQGGHYTAPDKPGPATITAISNQGYEGTTTITIACPPDKGDVGGECKPVTIAIAPTTATIGPGASKQFTATVTGPSDTSVTWTASGGSVTAGGLYTAPSTPGSYTVTATSVAAPSKSATAQVTVGHGTVTVTQRTENPAAVANATVYWSSPDSPTTVTVTDPTTPPSPSLLGSTGTSYLSAVQVDEPKPTPADGPEAEGDALVNLSTAASVSLSGDGQLSAGAGATFDMTAHGEFRTFQGIADVHTSATNQLTLNFTVNTAAVNVTCNADFSTPPDSTNGVQMLDSTAVTLSRTGSQPVNKINLGGHQTGGGSASANATLEPGTYTLVIYAGGAGRVYTGGGLGTATPLDLDWSSGGAANGACSTS